jgi:hypothetical protein
LFVVSLEVKYPAEYPAVAPTLNIKRVKGLADKDMPDLLAAANRTVADNAGMVAIWAVTETIKVGALHSVLFACHSLLLIHML